MQQETKLLVLTSAFITLLSLTILAGTKIMKFGPFPFPFAAGTITVSLTFPVTDTICEIWGKEAAKRVAFSGLVCYSLILLFLILFINLPAANWQLQEAYDQIFLVSVRITLAGIVSYTISQFHDIWAFMFWRRKTKAKYLWLRNNLSTLASQLFLTLIVVFVGFYGLLPNEDLLSLFFTMYLAKMLIALGDTPFVYLLVRWAKK